jgi:carbon monoxide dehydrogenase subunit G
MDLSGEYRIAAARETVWRALNDPDTLQASIPGCESLEKISDTEFVAKISTRIGPVSAKFAGKVTLSDLDPPNGYRIAGEGQGGAAGFAKGAARVTLADDGAGGTILRYEADGSVGGKIAQIGSRLVQGAAQKTADEFFGRFSERVAASVRPEGAAAPVSPPEAPPGAGAPAPAAQHAQERRRGLSPWVWITSLVAILGVLLAWFSIAD